MTTVLHGARLVDGGAATDDAWVAFADGVVTATGTGEEWQSVAGAEAVVALGAL